MVRAPSVRRRRRMCLGTRRSGRRCAPAGGPLLQSVFPTSPPAGEVAAFPRLGSVHRWSETRPYRPSPLRGPLPARSRSPVQRLPDPENAARTATCGRQRCSRPGPPTPSSSPLGLARGEPRRLAAAYCTSALRCENGGPAPPGESTNARRSHRRALRIGRAESTLPSLEQGGRAAGTDDPGGAVLLSLRAHPSPRQALQALQALRHTLQPTHPERRPATLAICGRRWRTLIDRLSPRLGRVRVRPLRAPSGPCPLWYRWFRR